MCDPLRIATLLKFFILCWIVTASLNTVVLAEGPQLTSIFPAGGQRGTTCEVSLAGSFPTWPVQIWCDQADCVCTATSDSGKLTIAIAADAAPGVRWLRIYNDQGASDRRPFLVGVTPEINEIPPDDKQPDQVQHIDQLPLTINGKLDKRGAADSFSMNLKQGEQLVASLDANRGPRSPVDATLQLLDAKGIVLEQNMDCHGLDPQLTFVAPYDGQFHVRVFGFPEAPDSTIAYAGNPAYIYRLTLTTGPYVEATMPLAIATGEATELKPLGYNLDGLASQSVTAEEHTVKALSNATSEHRSVHFPSASGWLLLPVKPLPVLSESDSSVTTTDPQKLPIPCCITGRLTAPKELDRYAFATQAGLRWKFLLESRALGYPLDGVLTLRDAEGKELARQDDSDGKPDPLIQWQAPSAGEFSIAVSDLFGEGGEHFVYRLTIEEDKPEPRLTIASELLQATVGKSLEIPVTINRYLDYGDELEITVTGLPASATVTPMTSITGNDSSKKVTLSVAASEPFQGPVQVKGRSASSGVEYLSTASDTSESGHSGIWLSVVAP